MSIITEIAFEINSCNEYELLITTITKLNIPYYIEPFTKFRSLEDLECERENK